MAQHVQKVRELELKRDRLQLLIERYLEEFEKGVLSGSVVGERIKKKQEELRQVEEELSLLKLSEPDVPSAEEILESLQLLHQKWESLSVEERNALLKEIFERIEVSRNRAILHLK